MENSGKAMSSVSFTGWPDAWVIPREGHRTGTTEHPPKPTHACEMAGLYGLGRLIKASADAAFAPEIRRQKAPDSGPKAARVAQAQQPWPRPAVTAGPARRPGQHRQGPGGPQRQVCRASQDSRPGCEVIKRIGHGARQQARAPAGPPVAAARRRSARKASARSAAMACSGGQPCGRACRPMPARPAARHEVDALRPSYDPSRSRLGMRATAVRLPGMREGRAARPARYPAPRHAERPAAAD